MPPCLDSLNSFFKNPLSDKSPPLPPGTPLTSLLPTSRIDPSSPVGASLLRLWSSGEIYYLSDTGTLYYHSAEEQYGVTNYGRVAKLDGANMWFVYDGARKQFKAVSVLKANEGFERWEMEELEERMFEEAPGVAERVGKWGGGLMERVAVPTVVGAVAGAVGARIARGMVG